MSAIHPLRLRDESGFTMVELLGVALIVTILSLMAMQVFDEVADRTRWAKSKDELRTIEIALERYRTDNGHYPDRLGPLVTAGYLKPNTTFHTPWASKRKRSFYFYAVDDPGNGRSMAYALGDPGPNCLQKAVLHADSTNPLPCGLNPDSEAFSFYVHSDLELVGNTLQIVRGHASLRAFRTSCRSEQEAGVIMGTGCDLKTES